MEAAIITGVAHDSSQAKITIVGVPDKPGEAAAIFRTVADAQINIDMIVQNISAAATGRTDISFTLPRGEGQTAMAALAGMQDQVGYESLQYDDSRSEEHTSELQSLMRISYAVFCLKKNKARAQLRSR